MSRAIPSIVLLTLVYAMMLASFKPLDLLSGAIISSVLVFGLGRFLFPERGWSGRMRGSFLRRLAAFPVYAGAVVWDIVQGTWTVALYSLGLKKLQSPGIVAVPIGERTPVGVAVSTLATTLSPGTFLVEVNWERRVMLIHSIEAEDPEAVRDSLEQMYQRYQKKVFP